MVPFIKAKVGETNYALLLGYIDCAVRCAEQLYTVDEWKQKKEYVLDYAKGIINNVVHISLTDEELDALIEGTVNEVKHSATEL